MDKQREEGDAITTRHLILLAQALPGHIPVDSAVQLAVSDNRIHELVGLPVKKPVEIRFVILQPVLLLEFVIQKPLTLPNTPIPSLSLC